MVKRTLLGRCPSMALAVLLIDAPVLAQSTVPPFPPGAVVQPLPPVDPLAANLKILAQNPYDVTALTAAGVGALEVGDPQAAIGFLARAEELSPRDSRIKAALGAALTLVERPEEALRTFGEAVALGHPERLIAKDRGLAFDLIGDTKRAQKDYLVAEKQSADAEVLRRHALSLGIAGNKEEALKLLDPLVRRNDQSAWRARAFILAMNGDMPEADRIIRAATPPSMVSGMSAFLRRLPSLTPAQRAAAVNFGSVPTTGPAFAAAEPTESFRPILNGQNEGLLGPSDNGKTQVASAAGSRPELSRSEQRKAERRERELAKLAAKGARASGVQVAAAAPPPTRPVIKISPPAPVPNEPINQRVGQRIGPVDPSRLPPEMRVPEKGSTTPSQRPVLVQGALPPPDGVRPPVKIASAEPILTPPRLSTTLPVPTPSPIPTPAPTQAPVPPVVATPAPVFPPPLAVPAPPPLIAQLPPAPASVPIPTPAPSPAPTPTPTPPKVEPVAAVEPPVMPVIQPTPSTPSPSVPVLQTSAVASSVLKPVELPPSTPNALPPSAPATTPPPSAPPAATPASVAAPVTLSAVTPPPTPTASVALVGPPASLANPPAPSLTVPPDTNVAQAAVPEPGPAPGFSSELSPPEPVAAASVPEPVPVPASPVSTPVSQAPAARLASILDGIETEQESAAAPLPSEAEIRAARLAAQKKADAEEKAEAKAKADKDAAAKAEKEAAAKKAEEDAAKLKANPARVWVQIATGANRSGLPVTWRKIKAQAPKALGEKTAWFMAFRSTHRLLVGPMKGAGDARALVAALSKEGIAANSWSSEAGQEVTRLGGR